MDFGLIKIILQIIINIVKFFWDIWANKKKYDKEELELKNKHLNELVNLSKMLTIRNKELVIQNEKDFLANLTEAKKIRFKEYNNFILEALNKGSTCMQLREIKQLGIGRRVIVSIESNDEIINIVGDKFKTNEQKALAISDIIIKIK